jgi:hypothetical protein
MTLKQMRERVIHARARLVTYHGEILIADNRIKHYEKTYRTSELGSAKRKRQRERLHDWRDRKRKLQQEMAHWRVIVDKRDLALKELLSEKPHCTSANVVEGGGVVERFRFTAHRAVERARDYYSETGSLCATPWAITNVPDDSYRSDCSSWSQVVAKTIQVPDPTGVDFGWMYTGTVVEKCKRVDQAYAEQNPGTAVLFGDGDAFHMGLSMGHEDLLVQHGVPPVEWGTFGQFGPGTEVRFYAFLT